MSDTTTNPPLATSLAPLQLAFDGGPRDGQTIQISATKCTIGSSEQATLRLVCKGVHPIHCMILRGESQTIIKRMSEDTYLNDNTFEDAPLHENDVLTVGPLRFRVQNQTAESAVSVTPAVSTPSPTAQAMGVVASGTAGVENEQLDQRCDDLMSQLETLQQDQSPNEIPPGDQPSSEESELGQRLLELEAAREKDRQELEAREQEIATARAEAQQAREALDAMHQRQQDEAASDVASALGVEAPEPEAFSQNYPQASRTMAMEMLNRLREDEPVVPMVPRPEEDAENSYESQQQSHESTSYEQTSYEPTSYEQSTYDQSQYDLDSHDQNTLGQSRDEQSSHDQSSLDQSQYYQSPSDVAATIATPYEQSSTEQSSYSTPEDSYQSPYDSSAYSEETAEASAADSVVPYAADSHQASDYGQTAADESSQVSDFSSDAAYENTLLTEDNASPQTEEDLTFAEPDDSAPVDTASILAKFGHTLAADDDDGTGTIDLASSGIAPDVPSVPSFDEEPQSSSGGGDDDESIDDYMTQLMARVGGGDYQSQAPAPSSSSSVVKESQTVMLPDASDTASDKKAAAAPLDPSEFVPRAVAPEASSNLRALRAVANTSARSAIDRHQRRSFDSKAYICWFIAIVASIVCLSMAFFAKNLLSLPTLVSMITLLIAFFATINALAYSAKAKIGARSTQKKLAANIEEASVPRLPSK